MSKNVFIEALKVSPFLMGILLLVFNVIFWSNCTKVSPINNITGTSISTSLVLYSASVRLNFCQLHRTFIVYDSFASIWIDLKKIVDPIIGAQINLVIVISGVVLIVWLIMFVWKKWKKPGP